jgi:hypothetical protein
VIWAGVGSEVILILQQKNFDLQNMGVAGDFPEADYAPRRAVIYLLSDITAPATAAGRSVSPSPRRR